MSREENKQERRRVGIVGFGKLGEFLYQSLTQEEKYKNYEVVFVWNRSYDKLIDVVPEGLRLKNLDEFPTKRVDLIIEVAHPVITKTYGKLFLQHADYFIGSPTALADQETEQIIQKTLKEIEENQPKKTGIYVPSGAFWGAIDIQKMQQRGVLHSLCVTMKKHPSGLKVLGECKEKLDKYVKEDREGECVLYEGPVRGLCPLAPNNVNTMACAAIAASGGLGFDGVIGRLVADKSLTAHVITIDAKGKPKEDGSSPFSVFTTRYNPAVPGEVTGSATYGSFVSSVERAQNQGCGMHFC